MVASAFSYVFITHILFYYMFFHTTAHKMCIICHEILTCFVVGVVRFAVHVLATDIVREQEGVNACGDALEVII